MGLDVNVLRSFLVQTPRATKILVTNTAGVQQEIAAPSKAAGGVTWAAIARTIETLDPSVVELFDHEDKIIRAQRFDTPAARGEAPSTLPAILERDAESARIAHFANLIAAAYRFSVETAFVKFVEIVERLDRRQELLEVRLERSERDYRRAMQEKIDEALEEAEQVARAAEEGQGNPIQNIVEEFAKGVAQGATAPNGKGRT